jgi:hypothetical protein
MDHNCERGTAVRFGRMLVAAAMVEELGMDRNMASQ